MKRVFSRSSLITFWKKYPETEQYLKTWYDLIIKTDWTTPTTLKNIFGNVSILKNGRVVFNLKGNKYRLVAKINYEKQWIFIRFIGKHDDYDKIDANTI
ncbi:MAG: addiction module toxin RelE [Marinilabiliales bacterium]|nr:MAG: addiction module toxin RelE [Marinilabiliales bacterium]